MAMTLTVLFLAAAVGMSDHEDFYISTLLIWLFFIDESTHV